MGAAFEATNYLSVAFSFMAVLTVRCYLRLHRPPMALEGMMNRLKFDPRSFGRLHHASATAADSAG